MAHCDNLLDDRKLGRYWEEQFCKLATQYGRTYTPFQIDRSSAALAYDANGNHYVLPDVGIWSAPGEYHEIKHKNPTRGGLYGLEKYRWESLLWFAHETQQKVYYTIHNHDLAGGRDVRGNDVEHWVTADVIALDQKWCIDGNGFSYVNGRKRRVPILFWPERLWSPLAGIWGSSNLIIAQPDIQQRMPDF